MHKREGRELEKDRYTWCRGCSSPAKGSTKTCMARRGAHLGHRKEVALGAVDPDTRAGRGSAWERRDGTPGRAPHGKGCTLEEQRLVAENDVEPAAKLLGAAGGRSGAEAPPSGLARAATAVFRGKGGEEL